MSYCRFENTSNDLADCIDALNDYDTECKDLSDYEVRSLESLLGQAREIVELTETIELILAKKNEK